MPWLEKVAWFFSDINRVVGLCLFLVLARIFGVPLIRAIRSKNGNGHGDERAEFEKDLQGIGPPRPPRQAGEPFVAAGDQRLGSGPTVLPLFMTRQEGEDLEELVRKRTHDANNVAQIALGKAEGVERRQDNHGRQLHQLGEDLAEHRGETREAIRGVREKQEESCERLERLEQQQTESGALLKAVAMKLGVPA